jgi:acyl-coenzyme A thioesterase PaaI-like protein
MTSDFIDAARFGDLVEGRGEVTRQTRNLVFVRATVWTGKRTLLNARACSASCAANATPMARAIPRFMPMTRAA